MSDGSPQPAEAATPPWTERIYRLPAALAARHARPGTDAHEELQAHVAYHMVKLSKSWRPGGMSFARYLYKYLGGVAAQGSGTLLPRRKNGRAKELRHAAAIRLGGRGGHPLPERRRGCRLEDAELVGLLLDALPPRRRLLVERCFFGGETAAEIGRALGLSRSWVSGMLAESLARMRQAAREMGLDAA